MIQKRAKALLNQAVREGVYDIYVKASGGGYDIYFRGKGGRVFYQSLEEGQGEALLAHFKFLAGMNTGEKRRIQSGACWYPLDDGEHRRLRLSAVGDFEGRESLVIRILHGKREKLEFWFDEEKELETLVRGRGLYLFAGPVGSGKTSLMFELARRYFSAGQVITIEDPVEVVESSFVQLQVNEKIGKSYDELIKLSLRHRPDLLIVGEIRDQETARAVLRASLTGYTVFSTVHASSVAGVWQRLLELGVMERELEHGFRAVVYQRLIGGKGILDVAKTGVSSWSSARWNEKVEQLVADGCLTALEAEGEKIEDRQAGQIHPVDGKLIG